MTKLARALFSLALCALAIGAAAQDKVLFKTLRVDMSSGDVSVGDALFGSTITLPDPYEAPTVIGSQVLEIWRANWDDGVRFRESLVGNATYHFPRLVSIKDRFPQASVQEAWEASEIELREWLGRRLVENMWCSNVGQGPRRGKAQVRVPSRHPESGLMRWLRRVGMAPHLDDSIDLDLLAGIEGRPCPAEAPSVVARWVDAGADETELPLDPWLQLGPAIWSAD